MTPTDAEIAALRDQFGITSNGRGVRAFTNVADYTTEVLSRWGTPTPADEAMRKDAERLDYLIANRAYVVSDSDAVDGYWLHWAEPDGTTSVQCDEYATPRAAIDAALAAQGDKP
jgi:hypothetical protein